jgi:hypothetical protein
MKLMKQSHYVLAALMAIVCSHAYAQQFTSLYLVDKFQYTPRALEVMQDNEYLTTGHETGNFYNNPLQLNGKMLDYSSFSLSTEGELTVIKGAAVTGHTIRVPFYVYLRRNGEIIRIPGMERPDKNQLSAEISAILKHAQPDDLLVIEPVSREDGPVKRILKVLKGGGC